MSSNDHGDSAWCESYNHHKKGYKTLAPLSLTRYPEAMNDVEDGGKEQRDMAQDWLNMLVRREDAGVKVNLEIFRG